MLARGERVLLRREKRIEAASAAIERKYRAQHAETLAGFRRTRAELEDLWRQLATVERHVEPKNPIETSE